ncbi:hypothetical protein BEN47_15345 [Hymenobacter lapidarius]|uniref:Uncharacterized protein n=1 Tax=Hymenobacter lapidarius TaxID=1908237 RepID=A0A1G1T2J1_9BACT|nr:hypothetical protein [Hymenobacter lapidarius]OGX85091.1 hypothetical protein BEN47_15345 [Hymenobacter lapidarius]
MNNPSNPHRAPGQPDTKSLSSISQPLASSHPPQTASALGGACQRNRCERACEATLRSQYPELRRHYLADQEGARICGWGSPWPDRKLASLDHLFAETTGAQRPESPAEVDAPTARCSPGQSDACGYSTPSLANHRAMPTLPPPARMTFDRYEDRQYYPNLDDCPPPAAITFQELEWWLTDPYSPHRAETKAIARELPTLMQGGYEPFMMPSSCFVAFSSRGTAEGGAAVASGLGVLHFEVDPARFTGQVRRAFLSEAFGGIDPPLLLNRWPSRLGLTAVVALSAGPESYAQKIEDLVVHFTHQDRYRGLRCHPWQNQDPNRPTTLYYDPRTAFRSDLLG